MRLVVDVEGRFVEEYLGNSGKSLREGGNLIGFCFLVESRGNGNHLGHGVPYQLIYLIVLVIIVVVGFVVVIIIVIASGRFY